MEFIASYVPPRLLPVVERIESQCPLIGVALSSFVAIYLGYLFVLSRREAPVSFNVPIPPELRSNWAGKNWDDVQGEERKVLEAQVKGVSFLTSPGHDCVYTCYFTVPIL